MQYYLHYVGKAVYDIEGFIREAKRFGVSRALPTSVIKSLNWGQPILLATYAEKKLDDKKIGQATIFGYFNVMRVRVAGWTEDMLKILYSQLDVVDILAHEPIRINRRCGSYTLGGAAVIKNTIADLLKKAGEVEKQRGVRGKWFVEGEFRELPGRIILEGVKFSRGLIKVNIHSSLEEIEMSRGVIVYSYDYVQRVYLRKSERAMFENNMLEEYV